MTGDARVLCPFLPSELLRREEDGEFPPGNSSECTGQGERTREEEVHGEDKEEERTDGDWDEERGPGR